MSKERENVLIEENNLGGLMYKIISFGLCPFVQRSLITLNYKKAPYEVEYIDLSNKPKWFLEISPLGKVPVLKVNNDVLFESAVINEYIDETTPPSLHPKDSFKKAQERAYIELAATAIMNQFQCVCATNKENYLSSKEKLEQNLQAILKKYQGPFFRGDEFSLVDTSFIPLIHRIFETKPLFNDLKLNDENKNKLQKWADVTLKMDIVKNSVPESFSRDYNQYLIDKKSYIHNLN